MVIGILQFELLIHGAESLKDKRRVVSSLKDRLHREHMVSVAEVGTQERRDVATMALACVCTDGAGAGRVLDRITLKLRALGDAELGDVSRQIVRASGLEPDQRPALDEAALAREMLERFGEGEG